MRAAILITNLIIAYTLLRGWPEALPIWARSGLALIIVMIAMPLSDASSKNKNRPRLSSLRAPKWLDYLYIGLVIFCIQLLLLAVFTLGPKSTEELHGDVKFWLTNKKSTADPATVTPDKLAHNEAGNWLWDNHFQRSHPKQTSKRPPNKPEIFMEVTSKYSQAVLRKNSIYLRTFALDHFDGDTWSIYQPTKLTIEKPRDARIQISTVNDTWRSNLPLIHHTITQSYYRNGQNILTTLHNTIETDVHTLTKVSTDTYILPSILDPGKISYSYKATSQPMLLDQILKLDKNITVGETHSVYLSRVSNPKLQQKLTLLANRVDKKSPLTQQLHALKKIINHQCTYSLDIKNENQINALENFLFVNKTGYCEFYASAAAMLCRELNIPSRIAFGWSGGTFYEDSNLYVFRSRDAHAWTEIYLDGYGWVIYDTTPPSEYAGSDSQQDEQPPSLTDIEEYLSDEHLNEDSNEVISWLKALIVIATIALIVIAILLLRRFTHPKQQSSSAAYIKHEPRYLHLFQKLSAKLDHHVKPSQTLMQSVKHLKNQQLEIPELDTLLDQILQYHYDITYRNASIDRATEARFTNELKKIYNHTPR